MKVSVFRKEHFNSAHRLNNPDWSDEKNQAVFGKCNNPHFHGHNYELIVVVKGEIDPETGYVYDMKLLSDLIKENVLNKFDHKNLNLDTDEFRNLNPSAENIAADREVLALFCQKYLGLFSSTSSSSSSSYRLPPLPFAHIMNISVETRMTFYQLCITTFEKQRDVLKNLYPSSFSSSASNQQQQQQQPKANMMNVHEDAAAAVMPSSFLPNSSAGEISFLEELSRMISNGLMD